jgi:hypothetical protein
MVVSNNRGKGETRGGSPVRGERRNQEVSTRLTSVIAGTGALELVWWYPTTKVREEQGKDFLVHQKQRRKRKEE